MSIVSCRSMWPRRWFSPSSRRIAPSKLGSAHPAAVAMESWLPPTNSPLAVPVVVSAAVGSSGLVCSWIVSVVNTARSNDVAVATPNRSGGQQAPCTAASPQCFISAMCNTVISLKPSSTFGSARAASTSRWSAIR